MPLSEIPYIRWAKSEICAGDYHLTSSAAPEVDWSELGIDPRDLKLFHYNTYGEEQMLSDLRQQIPGCEALIAAGASHAHFCIAAAILRPGDRILFEAPGYLPLLDSLSMLDVEAIRFRRSSTEGFALPLEQIEAVASQVQPRLILLTNLHNPSGVALTEAEMDGLAGLCERTGIEVLCDEVYLPYLDPQPTPLHARHPLITSVCSFNKSYGLPQIRVGWAQARPELVERARRIVDATTLHNSCLSDQVAALAWPQREKLAARSRAVAAAGWAVAGPWLEKLPLEYVAPAGGLICFPRVPEESFADGEAFREALLGVGVGVTPGSFFGEPNHVRIGFREAPERLEETFQRMASVF
ncbi:MAG: pyridoxal phosphate-dependent aminotransferase [Planctomycetota bacterium]